MLDEITTTWDKWVTLTERKSAKGIIQPANVAAVRFTINGVYKGETRIQLEHVNRIGNDAAADWPSGTENDVYRVDIEGTPSIYQETAFRFTDGFGRDAAAAGCLATGLRALNAVPAVNDLSPGWGDSFGSTTDSECGDHSLVTSIRQTTLFTGPGLGRYRVRCLTG